MIKNNLLLKNHIQKEYFKDSELKKFNKKYKKIFLEINKDIKNPKKTINVIDNNFKFNFKINDLKKFKKFKNIAILGMGGSVLGSKAIYKFLEKKIKKKIYFFDNLQENKIKEFKKKKLSKILFIVISKSGNTIETLSNVFALNIIKKNAKNIILISEKKNSALFHLSKKLNLYFVEHKNYVGGRYSVLSDTGIIPAYLMGINIFKFRSKIQKPLIKKNKNFLKISTIKIANLIMFKKVNNLIYLNYSPELEEFLYWCQQLIAESLGKKNKGFLPVVSNAPKDHHSLLQLYLDGPKDKIFYIFSHEKKFKEKVKLKKEFGLKSFLQNKNLSNIKKAQKKALIKAFIKNKIPFRVIEFKEINEEVLGELFSYFILETIIVGKLLNINPFDQKAVEQVKDYTKKLLT